jgi:Fe2+ transport system protein B
VLELIPKVRDGRRAAQRLAGVRADAARDLREDRVHATERLASKGREQERRPLRLAHAIELRGQVAKDVEEAAEAAEPGSGRASAEGHASPLVLLVGNLNSGKTTVFNLLNGSSGKVGNYPGITVDRRSAPLHLETGALELVDLPGTYSLTSRSMEEQVAVDAVLGRGLPPPASVVILADATTLRRGLYLATQVLDTGVPAVLALTMMDEARAKGLAVFAVVMALVFQALFSWSEPAIGLIEGGVEALKALVGGALAEGPFRDLLLDGVIAGVGNVVVFVPQIALLFVFVTVLEDSGYLARVAFVIDRVMGGVGLHGKAFVPMLSGFACAIPAVMATRTIESRRDRLLTMLVVPLTSCSARLPVYVLVIGAVFSGSAKVFGLLELGAVVLFSMYALSVLAAVGAAAVLRRTVLRGPRPTMVLELPPYRRPRLRNVALATWERVRRFLVDAGTVILALTIVLWAGLAYPKDEATPARLAPLREAASAIADEAERSDRLAALDAEEKGAALRHSIGGRIGTAIEPLIEPLGFDYRIGIGILGAFAAREVFVSTLGIAFDVGEADEESTTLRTALKNARRRDGAPLMTPLTGVSLMVFFVLACQCMSTIAVVRRESGSWKWPGLMFAYMSLLAYGAALLVYQGGKLFGWG